MGGEFQIFDIELWEVVFGSPVWSSFLTPWVLDHNRNQSFYFWFPQKTGPNQCGLVLGWSDIVWSTFSERGVKVIEAVGAVEHNNNWRSMLMIKKIVGVWVYLFNSINAYCIEKINQKLALQLSTWGHHYCSEHVQDATFNNGLSHSLQSWIYLVSSLDTATCFPLLTCYRWLYIWRT